MPDIGSVLAANLEVRITQLERNMKRATDLTSGGFDRIERRAKQSSQRLESEMGRVGSSIDRINNSLARISGGALSSVSRNALLAVAPMLTLGAAISGVKSAIEKFGEINDRSTRAGLDPEFFQGIAYQAKLAGVEIDGISSAAENFAKVSAQSVEGRGKLYTALQAEHAPLLQSLQLATSQEQRWRLIADAIRDAKTADDALVIATAAFGEQGAKLVGVFKDGGAEIDNTIAKAKELGLVVDRDVIARADELGDQWDTIAQIIDNDVKSALVNLGPVLVGSANTMAIIAQHAREWAEYVERGAKISDLKTPAAARDDDTLTGQLKDLGLKARDLDNIIQQSRATLASSPFAGLNRGALEAQIANAQAELKKNEAEQAAILAEMDRREQQSQVPLSPVLIPARQLGGDTRGTGRHDAGQLRDGASIDAVATSLEHVSKAAYDSTVALGSTGKAVDRLGDQLNDMKGLAQSFVGDLISGARNGTDAVTTLASAFGNLGGQLLQLEANKALETIFGALAPATGGVWGRGFWGTSIFDGSAGFANGGYTGAGGRNVAAGIVHRGEVVFSQDDVARHGGVAAVEALRRLPRFADGGVVGKIDRPTGVSIGGTSVSIAPNIAVNVEGGSRGADADAALAKQIGSEIDNRVRGLVADEIRASLRPGNMLNQRAR